MVEDVFLRQQLTLIRDREVKARTADNATWVALMWLAQAFDWRNALVNANPLSRIRCHCEAFLAEYSCDYSLGVLNNRENIAHVVY